MLLLLEQVPLFRHGLRTSHGLFDAWQDDPITVEFEHRPGWELVELLDRGLVVKANVEATERSRGDELALVVSAVVTRKHKTH